MRPQWRERAERRLRRDVAFGGFNRRPCATVASIVAVTGFAIATIAAPLSARAAEAKASTDRPPGLIIEAVETVPIPRPRPERPNRYKTRARNAIIVDLMHDEVLFERRADDAVPPASMTKLMTLLVALQAVRDGEIEMGSRLRVSQRAAARSGSSMYLRAGERLTLRELLNGVVVLSGNDAATAVAEGVAGSERRFVRRMNAAARELGLKDSHFQNPTGLSAKGHYMSAADLSRLARHLLAHYPAARKFFARRSYKWSGVTQRNRNPLLGVDLSSIGVTVDGMKTGYTRAAGYCAVISAVQKLEHQAPRRVVVVLAGLRSEAARASEAERAVRWAFAQKPKSRAPDFVSR